MKIHFLVRILFFSLLAVVLSLDGRGQQDTLFATNLRPLNDKRYKDIKGSPYLFNDWVKADIIRRDSFRFQDILLNYNGDTGEFEVMQDGQFIELQQLWYRRIEVDPAKNQGIIPEGEKIVFLQGFHPDYVDRFALLAYEGQHVYLIKEFSAVLSEKTVQNVGKAIQFKRFTPRVKYALYYEDQIKPVKLKKEEILEILGHESEASEYLKSLKIKKTNDEESVITLLKYLDDLKNTQSG